MGTRRPDPDRYLDFFTAHKFFQQRAINTLNIFPSLLRKCVNFRLKLLTEYWTNQCETEVLEGSSGEDETRRGMFRFSSAFSRTRRGIPRNFGLFLLHFKDETFDPCFSRSRTRRGEEFCLIPRPFRGRDETLENL